LSAMSGSWRVERTKKLFHKAFFQPEVTVFADDGTNC